MTIHAVSSDLGDWSSILGASIFTLSLDGTNFDATRGNIYGNGRHNAIVQVVVELGDANGSALKINPPTASAVQRSILLCNYDDKNELTEFGTEDSAGWVAGKTPNCFMNPLQRSNDDPIVFNPIDYKNIIKDGIAHIYYFINYSKEDFTGEMSCNLGAKIHIQDTEGVTRGKSYLITQTSDQGDPVGLIAIPPLIFTPDDFDWKGQHIVHDGENEDFVAGQPLDGNFWREVAYTVNMKENDEYPGKERYYSKIYRCSTLNNGNYRSGGPKPTADYNFGIRRNGLYNFTGYMWPYNVYNEEDVEVINSQPKVAPPAGGANETNAQFCMYADGMKQYAVDVPYAKYQLNFSLYCTFGWTSNDAYNYWPLYVVVYDQYGNVGSLCADPTLLPDHYVEPEAEKGLDQLMYFSVLDEDKQKSAEPLEYCHHVNSLIVSCYENNADKYYIIVDENAQECTPLLGNTSDSSAIEANKLNLFRLYRNHPGRDDIAVLVENISYNIINYAYTSVVISIIGDKVDTVPLYNLDDPGWILIPIWSGNSFAFYHANTQRYLVNTSESTGEALASTTDTEKPALLEWRLVVETAAEFDGEPDKGSGYDASVYDTPNLVSGRNSWVGLTNVVMTLSKIGDNQPGLIYSNGRNQAKITVQFSPIDSQKKPLTMETCPTPEYIKSVITAIDYNSMEPLERDSEKNDWDYSFESNSFSKHTLAGESFEVDWDSVVISETDAIGVYSPTIDFYVTCNTNVSALTKFVGLKIAIFDEKWGDPIVYTCSSQPMGGTAMNFRTYVELHTKSFAGYTAEDLKITLADTNSGQLQDDWPLNANGRDPDSNMWRLWHYRLNLKDSTLRHCAVDTGMYNASFERNGGCFSKNYDGLYATEAWLWPSNLVAYDFSNIPNNDVHSFKFGNYDAVVDNDVSSGDLGFYISVYYEFAGALYENTRVQNSIDLILYDDYGNAGKFHVNPGCVPQVYDAENRNNINLLLDGSSASKNINNTQTPWYNITSMDTYKDLEKVITLNKWLNDQNVWNVRAENPDGDQSLFQLQKQDKDFFWNVHNSLYLTHRPEGSSWAMIAGYKAGSEYNFFFKPVWNKRGFLMCTQGDGDSGRAFMYSQDDADSHNDGGTCRYFPIMNGDISFVWQTITIIK